MGFKIFLPIIHFLKTIHEYSGGKDHKTYDLRDTTSSYSSVTVNCSLPFCFLCSKCSTSEVVHCRALRTTILIYVVIHHFYTTLSTMLWCVRPRHHVGSCWLGQHSLVALVTLSSCGYCLVCGGLQQDTTSHKITNIGKTVKLSLSILRRCIVEVAVQLHTFIALSLEGGQWSVSCTDCFTTGERTICTHWSGGWMNQWACLNALEKRKIFHPCQKWSMPSSSDYKYRQDNMDIYYKTVLDVTLLKKILYFIAQFMHSHFLWN